MLIFETGFYFIQMAKGFKCQGCQKGLHYSKNQVKRCEYAGKKVAPLQSKVEISTNNISLKRTQFQAPIIPVLENHHFSRYMNTEKHYSELNCLKGIQKPYIKHKDFKKKKGKHTRKFVRISIGRAELLQNVKDIFSKFVAQRQATQLDLRQRSMSPQIKGMEQTLLEPSKRKKLAEQYFDKYVQEYGQSQSFGQFRFGSFPLLSQFVGRLSYKTLMRITQFKKKTCIRKLPTSIIDKYRSQMRLQFRKRFRKEASYKKNNDKLQKDFGFIFTLSWHNSPQNICRIAKEKGFDHLLDFADFMWPSLKECQEKLAEIRNRPIESLPQPYQGQTIPPEPQQKPLISIENPSSSKYIGSMFSRAYTYAPHPNVIKLKRLVYILSKQQKRLIQDAFQCLKFGFARTQFPNLRYGTDGSVCLNLNRPWKNRLKK